MVNHCQNWYAEVCIVCVLLVHGHINGWVQGCSNSSALVMELLQSCTQPSIYIWVSAFKRFEMKHECYSLSCMSVLVILRPKVSSFITVQFITGIVLYVWLLFIVDQLYCYSSPLLCAAGTTSGLLNQGDVGTEIAGINKNTPLNINHIQNKYRTIIVELCTEEIKSGTGKCSRFFD